MTSFQNSKFIKIDSLSCNRPNFMNILNQESSIIKNSKSDQEVLESIEKQYFQLDDAFDVCRYELQQIPMLFSSNDITLLYQKLIQQHHVISKKVLFLILQNQTRYKKEFEKIKIIQEDLNNTLMICKLCRNNLNFATHQFTFSSLQILYYLKKKKNVENLLEIMYNIKTLYWTKEKLQQLLINKNYSNVISLVSECQKAAENYKNYYCITSLYSNLSDMLDQVEESLDSSLSKICADFNVEKYSCIQIAYYTLGKYEAAAEQLQMHFTTAIHSNAFNSVYKYVLDDSIKQFNQLCRVVPSDQFYSCFVCLCQSLLTVLKSYYLIIQWHKSHSDKLVNYKNSSHVISREKYVLCNLESGITRLCQDIENKIVIYLDEFDLVSLKYEEFLQVLRVISRISKIIDRICKRKLDKLYKCTKEKCINYLKIYHAHQLDELRIFLENDGWKLCPVKSSFRITHLLEFKRLKFIFKFSEEIDSLNSDRGTNDEWTKNWTENIIPYFNIDLHDSTKEDILQNSEDIHQVPNISDDSEDDEIPDELKYDFVDEVHQNTSLSKTKYSGPIVTNTTLYVLRICGKYLQLIQLFENITSIVVPYVTQIFEFYFYTVYSFFAADCVNNDFMNLHGTNLKRTISRIKDNLIFEQKDNEERSPFHKVCQPHLSPAIDLNDPNKFYGLTERIIAVESLTFLEKQYESFRFYLDSTTLCDKVHVSLSQFYVQTIGSTLALRKLIYMAAISKAFNILEVLNLMNKVDWELEEVVSQHSSYIDFLVQEIQTLRSKMDNIQNHVPLFKEIREAIWDCVAYLISRTLVEGFSNAKKCSHGGRALMQLDFTQFVAKFEIMTLLKPMPYQDYVASYIKAYYLSESSIENWIKTHSEYSNKHLIGLMSCTYQNKTLKQRLMNFIEDQRTTK